MNILKVLTDKRKVGNFGEKSAVAFLKKSGYKILEKGFIGGGNEIDIIAAKDNTVAYIEVKTRSVGKEDPREPRPASSVTKEKQRKIISASKCYRNKNTYGKRRRFDIIEVYLDTAGKKYKVEKIKHLVNTFDLDTAYKKY